MWGPTYRDSTGHAHSHEQAHAGLRQPEQLVATCLSALICLSLPLSCRPVVDLSNILAPSIAVMSTTPPFTPEQLAWLQGNFSNSSPSASNAGSASSAAGSTAVSGGSSSEPVSGESVELAAAADSLIAIGLITYKPVGRPRRHDTARAALSRAASARRTAGYMRMLKLELQIQA